MANLMLEREPPEVLASRGQVIENTRSVGDFGRLSEIITADLRELPDEKMPQQWRQVPVDITLRFGWLKARPGVPVVEGAVSTRGPAVCQRCLGPVELPLDVLLKLLLPQSGMSSAGYEDFEVWEYDEHDVRPADIVEEALIMALPFSALHRPDDCSAMPEPDQVDDSRTIRPFEDLKSLMARADEKN